MADDQRPAGGPEDEATSVEPAEQPTTERPTAERPTAEQTAAAEQTTAAPGTPAARRLERSRVGTIWTSLAVALVVLLLLLVFILQNQQDVHLSYLWMTGSLPLGVALLFAAVGGALLVVLVGAARIVQLRLLARRRRGRRHDG